MQTLHLSHADLDLWRVFKNIFKAFYKPIKKPKETNKPEDPTSQDSFRKQQQNSRPI